MNFRVKKPKPKPIMKMVTQGRRYLGESWQEITVAVDDDRVKVVETRPTEAPPDGRPIYVPGMGEMSLEAVDFLLEGARKSQEYSGKHPRQMPLADFERWLNGQWQDYMAQKLAWFKGQTTLGAGGFYQRETPGRRNWNGGSHD